MASRPESRREGLVGRLAEDRADRGDVERAGGGDDQEHREDVRRAPDDLVVHPGDVVAVVLHVEGGGQPRQHEQSDNTEQRVKARAAVDFPELYLLFH